MINSLTDFLKATGNEYAASAEDGIAAGDVYGYIDTGSYSLNALICGSIYGGVPDSKVTGWASESSVGKTLLALSCAKSFLASNPEGIVIIFESESAISKDMLVSKGMDVSRVGVVPCSTIQEFRTQCLKVLDNYEKVKEKDRKPLMLMLDSLGMLATEKEVADALSGNNVRDMTRASTVRSAFRVLTLRLGRARIPLLMTNHVYADVTSSYGGNEVSGGGGFKYACSTIISMTKAQDKDSNDDIRGSIVTCTAYKSRLTREKLKIKTRILHKGGLDRYYGLVDIAEQAGVIKKMSTKYEFDDGTKVFESIINRDPKKYWTEERLALIEKFVQTRFKYIADDTVDEVEVEADAEA